MDMERDERDNNEEEELGEKNKEASEVRGMT